MNKKFINVLATILGLVIVIVYIVLTFRFRKELGWWAFMDVFAVFMAVFSHLMALTLGRVNIYVAKRMNLFALVFAILFVLTLIAEYIIYSIVS